MKRYLAVAIAILGSVTMAMAQAPTAPQPAASVVEKGGVGYLDVDQIAQESAAGREMMGRLQKLQGEKVAARKKLTDEVDALKKQIETQRATLSDAKVAEISKQVEEKGVAVQRFDEDAQAEIEKARQAEVATLEKSLMAVIEEFGRESGLKMIVNKRALVWADEGADVTDKVLRRFNTKVTK
jgi:outer membrane protein